MRGWDSEQPRYFIIRSLTGLVACVVTVLASISRFAASDQIGGIISSIGAVVFLLGTIKMAVGAYQAYRSKHKNDAL